MEPVAAAAQEKQIPLFKQQWLALDAEGEKNNSALVLYHGDKQEDRAVFIFPTAEDVARCPTWRAAVEVSLLLGGVWQRADSTTRRRTQANCVCC